MKRSSVFTKILLVLFLTVCLQGCAVDGAMQSTSPDAGDSLLPDMSDGGKLTVFFQLRDPEGPVLKMAVSSIEISAGEMWIPVLLDRNVDTGKVGKSQIFLGRRSIEPAVYRKLRINLENMNLISRGKTYNLPANAKSTEINLRDPLVLETGDSKSLFITLDIDATLQDVNKGGGITAEVVTSQTLPITSSMAYVTCPDIDTVYLVRSDKNWVYGSFAVSGKPLYLGINSSLRRLYVLASEEARIKVFDMENNLEIDSFKIPLLITPVYMTLNPESDKAYVLDDRGNLAVVELNSGNMLAKTTVSRWAKFVLYLDKQDRLAVSSDFDHSVYILEPENLQIENTITVAGEVDGLMVADDILYMAERGTDSVSIYNLNGREKVNSLRVGYSPLRMATGNSSVYVANNLDGTISVVKSGLFYVGKLITGVAKVQEMAVSSSHQILYAGNEESIGNLAVIDLTSNEIIGRVDLGSRPLGLALVQ